MADVRSIEPGKYNKILAETIKKSGDFEKPEWISFVKTSVHKERPNIDDDFWYKRAASILRQAYLHGIVGVNRLRTRYGGKKKRGSQPSEFRAGGGKIIRKILQQAEAAGLMEKIKGKHSGRKLTEKGKKLLEENAK